MSRRDQLLQAVDSVQGHVYNLIDSHVGPPRASSSSTTTAGPSSSSGSAASGVRRSDLVATTAPPLYSSRPRPGAEPIPEQALQAPAGQAQAAIDEMPRNRIARGSGREARQAAAALRAEQLRTGQLKTRHTFVSSGGRVLLDIHTVPQKTLTFMGGSAQRGVGAMAGAVIVHAQANERVSSIRLKIKAVARVLVPKAGTPTDPFHLEQSHPHVEPCVDKELLLLQLETQLYAAPPASRGSQVDPTLLSPGKHEFPFSVDIPAETSKGSPLPPSFVLTPSNTPDQVQRTQPASKWEALASSIHVPHLSNDWASVKWYAKVTVERPGLLRGNDRIFAPFVYLPPPPTALRGAQDHLLRRLQLANEIDTLLRRFQGNQGSRPIDLQRLSEPFAKWETVRLNYGIMGKSKKTLSASDKGSKQPGLFSKIMFGAQVEPNAAADSLRESYSLSLPKRPFVFPLRSGVPYIISRTIEWDGRGEYPADRHTRVPTAGIYQRTNVYGRGKGPVAGTTARFVCPGSQPSDRTPVFVDGERKGAQGRGKAQSNRQTEHWLGIVDLPPSCAPCFETPILTLDYYLAVRSPVTGDLLHCEPIVLVCPPSKPARPQPAVPPQKSALKPPSRPSGTRAPSQARLRTTSQAVVGTGSGDGRRPTPAPSASSSRRPDARLLVSDTAYNRRAASQRPYPPEKGAAQLAALGQEQGQEVRRPSGTASSGRHTSAETAPGPVPVATPLHSNAPSRVQTPAPATEQHPQSHSVGRESLAEISNNDNNSNTHSSNDVNDDDDDDDETQDANGWGFVDDELTDLPPSYFEATGQRDED